MTRLLRIVLIVGLVVLGFVAFYPPIKPPPDLKGKALRDATAERPLGQRAWLLGNDYVFLYRASGDNLVGVDTEIDMSRLLGEALLIIAATGVGVVLLWPGSKPA